MHPVFIQTAIFNSKSLSKDFFSETIRKALLLTTPSSAKNIFNTWKVWAKLSHWLRIARRKIGFRGGRRESINVIYINPKWRGGNTDVRFTTSLKWFTRSFIAQHIKIFIHFSYTSQQGYLYCQGFVGVHVNASRWRFETA